MQNTYYYKLFEFFLEQHNITLLDSDIQDILHEVYKFKRDVQLSKGIGLIADERESQINKHKWNLKDESYYGHNELIKAALFSINPDQFEWPFNWDEEFRDKMQQKNHIERLACAAALIASQIDREIEIYLENNKLK